jgi:hypothetical protein
VKVLKVHAIARDGLGRELGNRSRRYVPCPDGYSRFTLGDLEATHEFFANRDGAFKAAIIS